MVHSLRASEFGLSQKRQNFYMGILRKQKIFHLFIDFFFLIYTQLLEKEPRSRLGVRGCKHGEVADQPFFKSIDFDKLERKQLIPPFKPNLVSKQYLARQSKHCHIKSTNVGFSLPKTMHFLPLRYFVVLEILVPTRQYFIYVFTYPCVSRNPFRELRTSKENELTFLHTTIRAIGLHQGKCDYILEYVL